jgi:putative lipoprotein
VKRHIAAAIVVVISFSGATVSADGADSWVGRDKALHFTIGTALATGGYSVGALAFEKREARLATGLTVSLGASAAKEWRDRSHGGTPSWRDFTWGAVGAGAGVTVAWLIDRAIQVHKKGRLKPAPTYAYRTYAHDPPPTTD